MKNEPKARKTFPLEIEEELHKSLKIKAIEEGKTLHSLIIDTLSSQIMEDPGKYGSSTKATGETE
jgi:predicted HicB family RNase H-like nuclease